MATSVDESALLRLRITNFKNDPDAMKELNGFLDEIFEEAIKEVERRSSTTKKSKMVNLLLEKKTSSLVASLSIVSQLFLHVVFCSISILICFCS